MPLREFLRLAAEKLESGRKKQCSTDPSSRTENDFVELVYEDGQIMMQGQGQASRVTNLHSLASNGPRARYYDEMAPWLNYPVDDNSLQDYCSQLLPEISGNSSGCDHAESYLDNGRGTFDFLSPKARPLSCEQQTQKSKRKFCDIEESEFFGVEKRTAPARGVNGSKIRRAAQVHHLCERRRRDRINEKMRVLQELIPNCSKLDKASMLDEAIEYLKNLQHQVQIMSMGSGLYTPPMMFPHGTQHMYPAHLPQMGVGMGMCMDFATPAPTNIQRIPAFNFPAYGYPIPGLQGSVPRPPLVPLIGRPHNTCAFGSRASRVSSHSNTSMKLSSEKIAKDMNSEIMHDAEASTSIKDGSNQLEATNEVLNNQATDGVDADFD